MFGRVSSQETYHKSKRWKTPQCSPESGLDKSPTAPINTRVIYKLILTATCLLIEFLKLISVNIYRFIIFQILFWKFE
jgi:hypothetical protein